MTGRGGATLAAVLRAPTLPLAVGAAAAPLVAVLQEKALAPLLAACLALCLVAHRRERGRWPLPSPGPALVAALALAAWGALSAAWALEPDRALAAAGQLAGLALLAAGAARVASEEDATALRRVGLALVAGLAAALAAALYDAASGNALRMAVRGLEVAPPGLEFGLKPAASVAALLLPLVLAAPLPRSTRLTLLAAGVVAVLVLPGDTPKLAALAGAAVVLVASIVRWRVARPAAAVTTAALVALGPALAIALVRPEVASRLPYSAVHRLLIWDFAAARAAERPLLGWGMESSRALPSGRDRPTHDAVLRLRLGTDLKAALSRPGVEALPLHPHNGALQLRLELGWPGLLLGAALAGALALAAPGAAALGVLASALVTGLLSFGAWQPWWMAAQAFAAALAVAVSVRPRERR